MSAPTLVPPRPTEGRRRSPGRGRANSEPPPTGLVVTAGALAVLAVAIAVLAFSPTLNPIDWVFGGTAQVEVPDVAGATQARAASTLREADLEMETSFAFSTVVTRGQVITQVPESGASVDQGSVVTVTVSRGPARIEMPNLAGVTEETALDELEEEGLEAQVERVADVEVAAGLVIRHNPRPGQVVEGGSLVNVVVSSGPPDVVVPDLSGLTIEAAGFELGWVQLGMGTVVYQPNGDVAAGGVVSTDPALDATVRPDTPVNLVVSSGPVENVVPSLVGLTEPDAVQLLATYGLTAQVTVEVVPATDPDVNLIVEQSPDPGERAGAGSTVQLTAARPG